MKRSQLAAKALACWTRDALGDGERSLGRQELPELDLRAFFRAFAAADDLPERISLALVGFGADSTELKAMAERAKATCFAAFAADLHAAAAWRNDRTRHPIIVAYARGMVTGVNTLRHFCQPTSRDLTLTLLRWAAQEATFSSTPAHTRLLGELQALIQDENAFSFEQVRAFLEAWSEASGASAPRDALPGLGLLRDPNLFADSNLLQDRLEKNVHLLATLRDRSAGQMEAIRKRLNRDLDKAKNKAEFRTALKVLDKLQRIRRTPTPEVLGAVTLDEAFKAFSPLKPELDPADDEDDEAEEDSRSRLLNDRRLQRACAEALLDDREEELEDTATALSDGLREALETGEDEGDENDWQCEVSVAGESQTFHGRLDRNFVAWVRNFCTEDRWGGLIETSIPDLKRALEDFDRPDTLALNPEQLLRVRGENLGLTRLLEGWDEDLEAHGQGRLKLVALWEKIKASRQQLLGSLEELTHFPLEWFAGKSDVRTVAERYLREVGQLFGVVAKHYGAMAQIDPNWAKTTLEGLLALDVVQARISQPDGKTASKAVLLPTHPLHLWRYWRLSSILRGLGDELNPADRATVIQEASEPVQFLSVIYASPLPGRRGAAQVLPVANDLYRLATFENLRNAYNGPDGQNVLVYAVERFAAAHSLHVHPLRLVLVNPPQAGALMLDLLKLLDRRKRTHLPALRVEICGTPLQAPRLRGALLFDTKEREIIEEKVASGRLTLLVDRQPKPLDEVLSELQNRPAHIVAVFDEAPVSVRRGGAGERLPMSPFCVRRRIAFHRRWNELRLEPTAGDPPFFEFIELIKHVEGNEGEGTPYAWPEAESLRKSVDSVLVPEDFGAQWFLLADRALPEEGEMQAQRLVRRREGQRQVLLAARSYESIARLMLRVFEEDTPNLLMPPARLQELMAEGAHLIGAGLLDVVTSQEGKVASNKVVGLMGTLLAAREYLRRHDDALLVSTDSQLARTWLRLGVQGNRCDLMGVREQNGRIVLDCIEVKTTKRSPRAATDPEVSQACQQVQATLAAVREGLGDTAVADQSGRFLAAPRNEMLKEVLVQGCMGRFATREQRTVWAGWLARLFGPTPETPELRGIVVDVALGSAEKFKPEMLIQDGLTVRVEHLNEIDVQRLLEPAKSNESDDADEGDDGGDSSTPPVGSPAGRRSGASDATGGEARDTSVARGRSDLPPRRLRDSNADPTLEPSASASQWPPAENVFGLIGQHAAATKLLNKVDLAHGTGRRFTDTLFVGPAGVGKSSLARAVAKHLLDEAPVFSSGSDLPQPIALIERLRERGKVPKRAQARVHVERCLIFIDEVHALPKKTATALLSAMDDARIAPIGGVEYDFANAAFIAATTDKGLLDDTFVSRMDLIPLADYSLEELASIIWLHGRKLFGGFELAREICIEVAARNRCNPRRAVRSLENDLLAEFYSRLPSTRRERKNAERAAAELMTRDAVAAYYDAHGIDVNGLDDRARQMLDYLKRHSATSEDRLCRGLRISNRADFVELIEFLTRLGLLATTHAGRTLTATGRSYLSQTVDLRLRI